jgi:hypothetical protein
MPPLEPKPYRILVAGLVDDGFISTNNGFDKIVTADKDFIPPGDRQGVRVVVFFNLVLRVLTCLISFHSGRSGLAHPKTHISSTPAMMAIHQLSAGLSRGPPRENNPSPFFVRRKNFSLTLLTLLTCIRESRILNILSTDTDHTTHSFRSIRAINPRIGVDYYVGIDDYKNVRTVLSNSLLIIETGYIQLVLKAFVDSPHPKPKPEWQFGPVVLS